MLAGESSVILLLATRPDHGDPARRHRLVHGGARIARFRPDRACGAEGGAVGLLAVLALTTGIGAVQGFVHAKAQIASFVVTLAGLGLWSGAALTIAHTTIPVSAGYEVVGWLKGASSACRTPSLFRRGVLVLAAALRWLPFGRYVYAIGWARSPLSSRASGSRASRFSPMLSAGFSPGWREWLMVARTYSGNPTIADSLLLPSIAAVVVGGTAITGGSGGLGRTLVGALTIAVLRVGIAVVGLDPAYEPIAYGMLVAAAVALTIDRSKTAIVK